MTRYWLVSVKMVETIRWPKALYRPSSIALAVTPSRAAVSRSMSMKAARPCAPASLVALRSSFRLRISATSLLTHSVTVAVSAPSSDTRNSVGPVSASIVRSCVGCR